MMALSKRRCACQFEDVTEDVLAAYHHNLVEVTPDLFLKILLIFFTFALLLATLESQEDLKWLLLCLSGQHAGVGTGKYAHQIIGIGTSRQ